uniref:Uncharacterized protein n=1 Tax=Mycena chlorophos TaxID=658473 RepID=A0ABQ0LLF7_MYCCL|nr:predicted protein [Mycena chlorophos]
MAASPLSLFDELTRLTQPGYPVTEVLTKLLHLVGHDVCSTKRNHHAVFWAVSQARDIIDSINGLVKVAGEEDSWDAFDKYTVMILWIEKVLLTFSLIAEKDSIAARFASSEDLVEDVAFVDVYRDNRKELREIVQQLIDSGYLKGEGADLAKTIKAINKQDDVSTFRAAISKLREHLGKLTGSGKDSLAEVLRRLEGLHATLVAGPDTLAEDVFLFAIQLALLLEIVASRRNKKSAERISDKEFWRTALGWITVVEKHAKDPILSTSGLAGEYTACCTYILGDLIAQLPEAFKNLRPLVALTRRPFYLQSVAVVAGCAELATAFNKAKRYDMLDALNLALNRATTALEDAAKVQYDPTIAYTPDKGVITSFQDAEDAIKDCFQSYQLGTQSDTWQRRMRNSQQSDEERLGLLQTRFKAPMKPLPTETLVDIVVAVTVTGSSKPTQRFYKMDSALTLHALLWKEASLRTSVAAANDVRNASIFFIPSTDKTKAAAPLDLDTTIASLPVASGRKYVALSVPNAV